MRLSRKEFKHRGNGHTYYVLSSEVLNFENLTVKQDDSNTWEEAVFYFDKETNRPFVTGIKRFNDRFIEIEV